MIIYSHCFLLNAFFYVTRLAVWCDDKYVVERVEGQRCNCLKVCFNVVKHKLVAV